MHFYKDSLVHVRAYLARLAGMADPGPADVEPLSKKYRVNCVN